jgi:hypothetical protein
MDLGDLNQTGDEAYWFEYDGDPSGETALLIAPLSQLIAEECQEKATPKIPNLNGRFRRGRNIQIPQLQFGYYQRLVFQRCVKGWRGLKSHGTPIPYSEETKAAITEHPKGRGLLQFGYEIADALGEMSAEQIQEERSNFRREAEVPE